MRAVVMAGGEGTRLRPITDDIPKPFVRVAGKPVIEYGIERLVEAGITEIFLTTFYKPQQLIERLQGGSKLGARIFYSVEDEPLGTAGGVKKVQPFLDGTTVVLSGDVLCDVDVTALVAFHRKSKADATMALTKVDDPTEFGIVGTDAHGRITRFAEKPKREDAFSNLINTGVYVLETSALDLIPAGAKFDFGKQLFPLLLSKGLGLYGSPLSGFWMDVGRPADLLRASREMSTRRFGRAYRDASVEVDAKARVEGTDVYHDVVVEADADVTDSILYENARVERGARIARSILCPGAVVEAGAVVEDSVIGARSHVPRAVTAQNARVPAGWTFER